MENMDSFCEMLKQNAELYEGLLETEREKYDAAVKNDLNRLDETISKEQVFYLRMKGLEQDRQKLMQDMSLEGKKFREIIGAAEGEQKKELSKAYDRLSRALAEIKKVNGQSRIVIDIRLHRINEVLRSLGEKQNTYVLNEKGNLPKNIMISKKI
jgi:sensor histidine kinase YesM